MAPQYFNFIDDEGGSRIQILRPGIFDITIAIGQDGSDAQLSNIFFGSFPPGPGGFPVTDVSNENFPQGTFSLLNSRQSQRDTTFDRTFSYFVGGFLKSGFFTDSTESGRALLPVYSDRFRAPPPPPNSFVLPEQNQNFLWFTATPSPTLENFAVTVRFINFLDS
jgi:hypothetical protein